MKNSTESSQPQSGTVLYLHGFLSSPQSSKAVQVGQWLAAHRPDLEYQCPLLSPYPAQARALLDELIESRLPAPVYMFGSSLGGYWATWYAEKFDLRAVLINPATQPELLAEHGFVGVPLHNYHTGDSYLLTDEHIRELLAVNTPQIRRTANYWLMVQTGDETLDYRRAVDKYAGCRQLVEPGGSHTFDDFARWIPAAIEFLISRP